MSITKETYEKSSLERRKEFFKEYLSKKKINNGDTYLKPGAYKTYVRDLDSFGEKLLKPRKLYDSTDIKEIELIKEELKLMKNSNNRNTVWKYISMKWKDYIMTNNGQINTALKHYISFLKTLSNNN